MKKALLLCLFIVQLAFSQERYLVNGRGDAFPLRKGESGVALAKRLGFLAPDLECSPQATFGNTPDRFVPDAGTYGTHKDILCSWFIAPASGTIDSVFWIQGNAVCAQESTVFLRILKSNIYPGHGPGYNGFPAPSTTRCWGYFNSTFDADTSHIAAFPEDASDTTWVSTVVDAPGPSFPPVGNELWGLGGYPIRVHAGKINGVGLNASLNYAPVVTVGDPFFITLRINGFQGDPCGDAPKPNTSFT